MGYNKGERKQIMKNTKKLSVGMICCWHVLDVYSGDVVEKHKVRLVNQCKDETWVVRQLNAGGSVGNGWKSWELFPVNEVSAAGTRIGS